MSTNWKDLAGTIKWNIQPFINGRYRPSRTEELVDNVNPASETVLCRYSVGTLLDIDEAVRAARNAFNAGHWSELTPTKRSEILLRFADQILAHNDELALLDTLEMGKPIQAALEDVEQAAARLRAWAGFADKLWGATAALAAGTLSINTYEPRGVVGAITPWNFPSANAIQKIGPALAAGNTVVVKPSELCPSSALRLAEIALEAGVPEGVLNVVPGLGTTVGSALALHPDVDLVSFTGSTMTGRKLMGLSSLSNGKPLLLECGGKSPHVVFTDIDNPDRVAEVIAQGVLRNQGQVCSARTRLIVDREIKAPLLEKVVRRISQYTMGDPLLESTTFGPLASTTQRDRVRGFIEQGIQAGADPVLKGVVQESGGCFVTPTVFDRVESHMTIAQEEIFGPVLSVLTFSSEPEAVSLANATDYGLEATVWTRDMGRGKRLAHAIRAGELWVRTSGAEGADTGRFLSSEPQKASGFGAELGLGGLRSYSTLKSIKMVGA